MWCCLFSTLRSFVVLQWKWERDWFDGRRNWDIWWECLYSLQDATAQIKSGFAVATTTAATPLLTLCKTFVRWQQRERVYVPSVCTTDTTMMCSMAKNFFATSFIKSSSQTRLNNVHTLSLCLARSASVAFFLVTSLVRSWNFIYLMCPFQKSQTPNEKCPKKYSIHSNEQGRSIERKIIRTVFEWVSLCNGSFYTLVRIQLVAVHKINIFNAFFSKHSNFLTTASGMPLRFGGENNKYNFRWK